MGAMNNKAFFGQHTYDRRKQSIITREQCPSDSSHDPHTRRIWAQIGKRWPAYRPDQDQISAPFRSQTRQDLTGRSQPDITVRPRFDHARFGKILEPNDEDATPKPFHGARYLPRQWPSSSQNAHAASG